MLPRPASMFNLAKDNGQHPTLASMLPPLLITEVQPAAATRGAEGAGLRSVMRRETIGFPARRRLYLLLNGCPCRGQGPFRGLSLMIVFGAGGLTHKAGHEGFATRRLT